MRFINPRTDFAFKKIFGSAESGDILVSFLNALLGLQAPYRIESVTILDPYQAPQIIGMKDTYVDVKARDESGSYYVIEMQVLNVIGFEQRVLYNACKAYAGQISSGDSYRLLTDVIALTITDFIMFDEQPSIVNKFKLRADNGAIYSDDLELVFAELSKFKKSEAELTDIVDKWLYFMSCAEDLTVVPATLAAEPAIQHAFDIANRARLSAEEEDAQTKREIYIQDQRGAVEKALDVGRAEGMEKGKAAGKAEGDQEARRSIARALLPPHDDAAVATITGLTTAAVAALRSAGG